MITCIVGPSCAGKTTAAEYINSELKTEYLEASDAVRERWSNTETTNGIMSFVKSQFEKCGYATFAEDIVNEIQSSGSEDWIICGFRAVEEVELIREDTTDNVRVIGIYANSLLRYQRKLVRDNPDPDYSYIDFLKKDFREYEFGIMRLLRDECDFLVLNEIPMGQYETKLSEIINTIY